MEDDEDWPPRALRGLMARFLSRKHERRKVGKHSEPRIGRIARMKSRSALAPRFCLRSRALGGLGGQMVLFRDFVLSCFRDRARLGVPHERRAGWPPPTAFCLLPWVILPAASHSDFGIRHSPYSDFIVCRKRAVISCRMRDSSSGVSRSLWPRSGWISTTASLPNSLRVSPSLRTAPSR